MLLAYEWKTSYVWQDTAIRQPGDIDMLTMRNLLPLAVLMAGLCIPTSTATAGSRTISGGHPYHNGYYFIPPASAWEAPRVRPPIRYGAPAYYYPQSYMPAGVYYNPTVFYPGVSYQRNAYYYMSAYSYQQAYPW